MTFGSSFQSKVILKFIENLSEKKGNEVHFTELPPTVIRCCVTNFEKPFGLRRYLHEIVFVFVRQFPDTFSSFDRCHANLALYVLLDVKTNHFFYVTFINESFNGNGSSLYQQSPFLSGA